jgi:hypothetical protein
MAAKQQVRVRQKYDIIHAPPPLAGLSIPPKEPRALARVGSINLSFLLEKPIIYAILDYRM